MMWPTNRLRIWPTFRCTRDCGYCANWQHGKHIERDEVTPDVWANFIANVEGVGHVVISGGEPSLHPGFLRIVTAALERGFEVGVYSNCSGRMAVLAGEIPPTPRLYFDFSFHQGEDVADYAARFNQVLAAGHRRVTAYTIVTPDNIGHAYEDAAAFYKLTRVRLGFKPLDGYSHLWYSDHASRDEVYGVKRKATCIRDEALVAPDGKIYWCHHFMYTNDKRGVIGNIKDNKRVPMLNNSEGERIEMLCNEVGQCNTCDVGSRRIDGQTEKLDG